MIGFTGPKSQLDIYLAEADYRRYKKDMEEFNKRIEQKKEVERQFADDYRVIASYNKGHDRHNHSPILSSIMLQTKED